LIFQHACLSTLIHHQENKKTSLSPEGQGVRIVVRATK
jgi:hypothetical protein